MQYVAMSRKVPPQPYRGTSYIRKRAPLGPYRRPMPRVGGEPNPELATWILNTKLFFSGPLLSLQVLACP
jgi:hypothetical protein